MSFEHVQRLQRELMLHRNNSLSVKNQINSLIKDNNKLSKENNKIKFINNSLEKKMTKLVDRYRCVVCFTNPKNVIFNSCFHFSVCTKCLGKLTECPICREEIDLYSIVY